MSEDKKPQAEPSPEPDTARDQETQATASQAQPAGEPAGQPPGEAAAKGPGSRTPAAPGLSAPAPTRPPVAAAPSRSGSAGLWLALLDLIAIIGLAAAGYLFLQGQQRDEFAHQQQLESLKQTVNQLDVAKQSRQQWFGDMEERSRESRRELSELQRQQGALLTRLDQNEKALGRLADQVQGGQHAWQRAEIEHLLLVANTRLQLQQDLDGAQTALQLADRRLASLANPAYFDVRRQIAQELSRLEAVPRLDVQALALQLDSLSTQVEALATRRPRAGSFDTDLKVTGGSPELPWHSRLWVSVTEALNGLVSIRRDVERREPLLPPDQSFYLRQNLRLQLESARLAALKQDTANYRAALTQAQTWLQRYFDTGQRPVSAALQTIGKLQGLQLKPALPDISGSLEALRRTGGAPE